MDVKTSTYIDFQVGNSDNGPKFKVGNPVGISKYKNIFGKGYTQKWSEEVFTTKKAKNIVPWTYLIRDLNSEEIVERFYEKDLQKNQTEFKINGEKRRQIICLVESL